MTKSDKTLFVVFEMLLCVLEVAEEGRGMETLELVPVVIDRREEMELLELEGA